MYANTFFIHVIITLFLHILYITIDVERYCVILIGDLRERYISLEQATRLLSEVSWNGKLIFF